MAILAIDQGTTGTTTLLIDRNGQIIKKSYREIKQFYPKPGWVEHDPEDIWQSVIDTINDVLSDQAQKPLAIGITNQRETTVLWNRKTGKPIHRAIVWQCRRTADICASLNAHAALIKEKTGLPLDAYFSGTKIKWILDNIKPKNSADICFGTIDSWLIWKLTNGKTHATDMTNASRTLLFNIQEKKWDQDLLRIFNIPRSILPEVKKSKDNYGQATAIPAIKSVPIYGVAGDQQAALFGQTCFKKGDVKNTYGTGAFMVMNTGPDRIQSPQLVTTLAADETGSPCYALEGSIFIAGAAIQWLRDELKMITHANETESCALQVSDNGGVYFVPAFVGLGAPYWDMQARGAVFGLTRGTNRNHIIRAALEAMAYQSYDVLQAMEYASGLEIKALQVDGGATANNFLMQFQADIIQKPILRPKVLESTALGAAMLAGLQAGIWPNAAALKGLKQYDKQFDPKINRDAPQAHLRGWHQAIKRVLST